jgi:hypothetical protein
MNSLKEIIDILELNFNDNLGVIKRILQFKMKIDVWIRKLALGVDPSSDDFIDEILLDDIKRKEEANHVNFDKISHLENILLQEINLLRNLLKVLNFYICIYLENKFDYKFLFTNNGFRANASFFPKNFCFSCIHFFRSIMRFRR